MREHTIHRDTTTTALVFAIAVVAVLLQGCAQKQAGGGGFSMPPMPVEVATASVRTIEDRFEAVGTIEALEAITVVSEIDAAVTALPFREGSYLQQGELIAQLDDVQLAAEVSRNEALHAQSHSSYDRVKSVVDQKAGTPQDLDDAGAALKVADANLAVAKARFAKTRITAPFAGVVGARKVSVGTFLRTGTPITELANIDEIRVFFSAPERLLPYLERGADVTVSAPAYPGYEIRGKISAIEPVLDPGTRSARIVARLQNPGRKFRPGMSANVAAVLNSRPGAIAIPSEAVFASGTQSFVYLVKPDSTVVRTPITLGTRLPDIVEIVDGLSPGSSVVRAGHQKLFDGARVLPIHSAMQTPNQKQ
jgi:membrane fusion protein, multidrug efflux system